MRRRVVLIAVLLALAGAGAAAAWRAAHVPVALPAPQASGQVLAADGSVLATLHGEQDRRPVPLGRVPKALVDAVVATEDARFWSHGGVDLAAIARALWRDLRAGRAVQGGSTITQQLAKNLVTGSEPTLGRKLREAWTAVRIESTLGKGEILETYLNTVYFGGGAYGVQAAAQRWFAEDVADLDVAQSALLAGLIRAPAAADPVRHPDVALAARARALRRMAEVGSLPDREAARLARRPLAVRERPPDWRAPWFVDHVLDVVEHDEDMAEVAPDAAARVDRLYRDGLRVRTTLDPVWQQAAERAIRGRLTEPGDPRAALVSVEPATGAVRALVGGRRYGDPGDPVSRFNLATDGARQPGSAFKPLVLAAALLRGHSLDEPWPAGREAVIDLPGSAEPWVVRNYDDRDHGVVTLREATRWSVNTVYARLMADIGPKPVAALARAAGVRRPVAAVHSIALGAIELSPLELATVQATLAAGGIARSPWVVAEITDRAGKVLYRAPERAPGRRVLPAAVAWQVTEALRGVVDGGTGQAARIGRPLAGKTGTTQGFADAWFAGYTPQLAAAVWIGFPQGAVPMVPPTTRARVEGGGWPAEIFGAFARAALAGAPERDFPAPDGMVRVQVDTSRNCLPNAYTPAELVADRSFVRGAEPTEHCTEPTGPDLARVPDVTGQPVERALRMLGDAGLRVVRRAERRPDLPPGRVVRQSPVGGAELRNAAGATVTIWVSAGAEVTVPDVLGLPVARARAELEAAGLIAEIDRGCPDGGDECQGARLRPGTVWEQSPDAGRRLPFGTLVTLRAYPT